MEWDLENCDRLKFNRFGEPDRIISRGHGHGVSPRTERFVRTGRGFPEGVVEAWANLYTEFAMGVAARLDGREVLDTWLEMPRVAEGALGVKFVDACVRSHDEAGNWVQL